jgi:type II secretory pathway component PulF
MIGLKLISWQACDKNGELISGMLVAKNKTQVQEILLERSLIPVNISYQYFRLSHFSHQSLPDFFFSNFHCYCQMV